MRSHKRPLSRAEADLVFPLKNEPVEFEGMLLGQSEQAWIVARLRDRTAIVDECWLWTGYLKNGYGAISVRNWLRYIHRLSCALANGSLPDGLFACHRCDVRNCWNPAHLFPGTQADNVADAKSKGRAVDPPRTAGEQHYKTTLTDDQVAEIRSRAGEDQRSLAAEFGCSQSTVWRLLHGKVRA